MEAGGTLSSSGSAQRTDRVGKFIRGAPLGSELRALAGRSEGGPAAYLEESAAAFRSALQVRTRELNPLEWAAAQHDLANVLRDMAARSDGPKAAEYLDGIVAACRSAASLHPRTTAPGGGDDAGLFGRCAPRLGGAGRRSAGAAYLGESIDAYRSALLVRTEAEFPVQWTQTMENLASSNTVHLKHFCDILF